MKSQCQIPPSLILWDEHINVEFSAYQPTSPPSLTQKVDCIFTLIHEGVCKHNIFNTTCPNYEGYYKPVNSSSLHTWKVLGIKGRLEKDGLLRHMASGYCWSWTCALTSGCITHGLHPVSEGALGPHTLSQFILYLLLLYIGYALYIKIFWSRPNN